MSRRIALFSGVLGVLIAVAATLALTNRSEEDEGEEQERPIALEDLPEPARQAILREANGHEIVEVEEVVQKGRLLYEAEWIDGAREVEVGVTADGVVVEREVEDLEDEENEGAEDR